MAKKRLHIYYSGIVQGVGFRYTAQRAAEGLGINGWVKNTADGRVEAVCEAEEAKLTEFIEKIKTGPLKSYIQKTDVDWSEATGEFSGFEIRFR